MAKYEKIIENPYKNGDFVKITSNDLYVLSQKINSKLQAWEKQNERDERRHKIESLKDRALELTEIDVSDQHELNSILKNTLDFDDTLNWENLKDFSVFRDYIPSQIPQLENFLLNVPKKSILDFIPKYKEKRINAEHIANLEFKNSLELWEIQENINKYTYEAEKQKYYEDQKNYNDQIEYKKKLYEGGNKDGVEYYLSLVLDKSKYPDFLQISNEIYFDENQKILIINLKLPNSSEIPYTKEHKYVSSREEIDEIFFKDKEKEKIFNNLIYQIMLRTLHEIFESDYHIKVETVVLNGLVNGIDSKTGKELNNCIATIQVNREEFLNLNLEKIVPQECFRFLKGKTAGSLVLLSPVAPIMKLDTNDKRIINADSVINNIDESVNLASMDWQDFEILVRDLLKNEFDNKNSKVEVTRASRDAGVDAIAYDEDPIRGGKYVIQAKRYNNLVPLSAVRDLYGTVMNEGAVKGLLVTTSYFGRDSLEFVKDKPLKLINGEELIYMFNKYGYKVKIELSKKQKSGSSIVY